MIGILSKSLKYEDTEKQFNELRSARVKQVLLCITKQLIEKRSQMLYTINSAGNAYNMV
jgi:hypothetical protein